MVIIIVVVVIIIIGTSEIGCVGRFCLYQLRDISGIGLLFHGSDVPMGEKRGYLEGWGLIERVSSSGSCLCGVQWVMWFVKA